MDLAVVPPELEELIICSCCHLAYNDSDAVPKLFTCRHYFCLKCVNSLLREGSDEIYCIHCWKRTELQGPEPKSDNLPTYNAILYLTQNLQALNVKAKIAQTSGTNNNNSSSSSNNSNNNNNCNNTVTCNGVFDKQQRSASIASNSSNGGGGGGGGFNGNNNQSNNSSIESSSNNNNGSNAGNNGSDKIKIGENCMTHAMPNNLWCSACNMLLCRACAATEEHRSHAVKNKIEAKETLHTEISTELLSMQKTLNDVQHLVLKQRDFLLKILESCTTLKTQIETELINHMPTLEISEMRESLAKARLCLEMLDKQTPADALKLYATLHGEKQRLMSKYQEMFLQCKLDDLIRNCGYVFDFDLIKQSLIQLHNCVVNGGNLEGFGGGLNGMTAHQNPVLLLANYCISQLYSRHMLVLKQQQQQHQHLPQAQQQHHQQLLPNGLLTSIISQHGGGGSSASMLAALPTSLSIGSGNNSSNNITSNGSYTHATYAQALQQNQHSTATQQQQQQQQQQHSNNAGSPIMQKSYADIITPSNKTNLHMLQHTQQQQQQTSNSNYSDLAPIGTPASTSTTGANASAISTNALTQRVVSSTAHLFSSNDLNSLGLSLLHLQHHTHATPQTVSQQQQQQHQQQQTKPTLLLNPSVHVYPIYYFNIEINGQPSGRILIEVRSDVAPKMAKNFNALATQELGYGYKGCHIFQCWENESIITGDFELNNGRGGRSVYDEGFFMPDDTKILAIRGSVGMRRSQKRHDNLGLVGSQFRIILREMRGFTGIFAFVVEGLELVEKISQTGDATGKPQSSVVIVNCGKYQLG